jgi:hypothetical protein
VGLVQESPTLTIHRSAWKSNSRNFDETVANHAKGGNDLVLRGKFSGVDVAYRDTDRDLEVILEIFSGIPDDDPASP